MWSDTTSSYLAKDPRFEARWSDGTWTQYRLHPSDPREVVTETGSGSLGNAGPHGADVILTGVRLGDLVSVRTNFHPAWTARANHQPIPLVKRDGQLALAAPCTGDCIVSIAYRSHRGFIPLAIAVVVAAGLWTGRRAGLPANPHARPTPSASATRLM